MARALVNIPKQARKGDVIDIKVLISHPMESGQRHDDTGQVIPRKIINRFVCAWNGREVFSADFFPAIAANPFLSFTALADESGTITLTWTDDDGVTQTEQADIVVSP